MQTGLVSERHLRIPVGEIDAPRQSLEAGSGDGGGFWGGINQAGDKEEGKEATEVHGVMD